MAGISIDKAIISAIVSPGNGPGLAIEKATISAIVSPGNGPGLAIEKATIAVITSIPVEQSASQPIICFLGM